MSQAIAPQTTAKGPANNKPRSKRTAEKQKDRELKRLRWAAEREISQLQRSVSVDFTVDPVTALQEVLDGAVADLRASQARVNDLEESVLWRDTMVGKIPNEWIRIRNDLRNEVERIANNMVRNGIADRAVQVSEAMAAMLVPVFTEMMLQLDLTPEQKALVPSVIEGALLPLERGET